jgi:hypothetical protein
MNFTGMISREPVASGFGIFRITPFIQITLLYKTTATIYSF